MAITKNEPVVDRMDAIEADDYDSESDYGYESSIGTATTSLSSSIYDHVYENGRRYHRYAEGKYALPNDEKEQDRLDLAHHHALLLMKGNLFFAPIPDKPQRILDCGTGTGIWVLDMADTYPSAQVTGVDLSPIQPKWVAPNAKFEVDDIELEWSWPENHFDFIHSRDLSGSIRDWNVYAAKMFKHIKPGGYAELNEIELGVHSDDGSLTPDCALSIYFDHMLPAAAKAGLKVASDKEMEHALRSAGFVDVHVERLKNPWGPWAKDKNLKKIGAVARMLGEEGMEAYALALLTRFGGLSKTEAGKICDAAKNAMSDRTVHGYNYRWVVYGRKPDPERDDEN